MERPRRFRDNIHQICEIQETQQGCLQNAPRNYPMPTQESMDEDELLGKSGKHRSIGGIE